MSIFHYNEFKMYHKPSVRVVPFPSLRQYDPCTEIVLQHFMWTEYLFALFLLKKQSFIKIIAFLPVNWMCWQKIVLWAYDICTLNSTWIISTLLSHAFLNIPYVTFVEFCKQHVFLCFFLKELQPLHAAKRISEGAIIPLPAVSGEKKNARWCQ